MNFNVIYIEDDAKPRNNVLQAVSISNEDGRLRKLNVIPVAHPDELEGTLFVGVDLILADVCFGPDDEKFLDRILVITKRWCDYHQLGKLIPVIAYTRRQKAALDYCIEVGDRYGGLYDIWDKSTASPPYVAWRLERLAIELSRSSPDTTMLRLIRGMKSDARWHGSIVEMVNAYGFGWNERCQIQRVAPMIGAIGGDLGTESQCIRMWSTMENWEFVERAILKGVRGHARHVLNVFWLGYYLLQHPVLRDSFRKLGASLLTELDDNERDPVDFLCEAWFYASIFHDIGGIVEKRKKVSENTYGLLNLFLPILKKRPASSESPQEFVDELERSYCNKGDELVLGLGDVANRVLASSWNKSIDSKTPDHGVVSALLLTHIIKSPAAVVAARAMSLHNLIGSVRDPVDVVEWNANPIGALLVLCDQLQTWDRERGDLSLETKDGVDRAELVGLRIEMEGDRPTVVMDIDYLGERHLAQSPEVYQRVKNSLETVIQMFPIPALRCIAKPWPFLLRVNFWLNGRKMTPVANGFSIG